MKLHKTGKMVRILSMVLVVAIMMSVCLVQAFAGSTYSSVFYGYQARGTISHGSNNNYECTTSWEVSTYLEAEIWAYYRGSGNGIQEIHTIDDAYFYTMTATTPSKAITVQRVNALGESRIHYDGTVWVGETYIQST